MAKKIDIFNIEPVVVPTNPSDYSSLIYGLPKIGKTTLIHDLYKGRVLMLMTEKRFKALAGANVQYISSWPEYLQVMAQLRNPKAQELYDVVSVDTVENLYEMLETFIAGKYNESKVGERQDIWGADHIELRKTWKQGLKLIEQAGFTPNFVSHAIQVMVRIPKSGMLETEYDETIMNVVKDKKDGLDYVEFEKYVPDLKDKVLAPINKMVDNIMFLTTTADQTGQEHRVIHMRDTLQWQAGSTFKDIQTPIALSADALKAAIVAAIGEIPDEFKSDDKNILTNDSSNEAEFDFDKLMAKAKKLAVKFHKADRMDIVTFIVEKYFGLGEKLTSATPTQVQLLSVAVNELENAIKVNKIK